MGRPAANTRIGEKTVHTVRGRGGNLKYRALRLDTGNVAWASEASTHKARILDVVYNSSNNELVRTKTLVKGAVIEVDATPFRQWYEQHYNAQIGKKHKETGEDGKEKKEEKTKKSKHVLNKIAARSAGHVVDILLKEQFNAGRLYAVIASRPGQSGRCDGYILEGKELEFYTKKMAKKK